VSFSGCVFSNNLAWVGGIGAGLQAWGAAVTAIPSAANYLTLSFAGCTFNHNRCTEEREKCCDVLASP
jgi:hypothetical protein